MAVTAERGATAAFLRVFLKAGVLQLADIGTRLLILKVLTSRLSQDAYGGYSLVTATAAFGSVLFGFEAYRYLQRHVTTVPRPAAWVSAQLITETAFLASVALIASLLPASALPESFAWLTARGIALVAAIIWTELMIVELVRYAVLQRRGVLGEAAKLCRSIAQFGMLALLPSLTLDLALVTLVSASLVATVLLAMLLLGKQEWRQDAREGVASVSRMLGYARFFILPAIANQLLKVGDRFFVFGMLSAGELAIYSIAYNIQLLCYGVAGGLASSLVYPLIVRDTATAGPPAWWRWLRVQLAIQAVASVALYAVAALAIKVVATPEYAGAVTTVRALAPLPILMVLSGGLLMRFVANGEVRPYAVVTIVSAGIAVALYALLIPRYGMLGAVAATLGGYAGSAALSAYLIRALPNLTPARGVDQ